MEIKSKKNGNYITRRLFKHGGSLAMNLPSEFVKNIDDNEVLIEILTSGKKETELRIFTNNELDNIESEPEFELFIKALTHDALTNPQNLRNLNETWDKFDNLLDGVDIDEE